LADRIVVRGSACEAASWTSRSGTPASCSGDEGVSQRVGRDLLAGSGAVGGRADDPPGGDEQGAQLVAIEGDRVRFVVHPRTAHVRGR
jgi:hypothetical protein